MLGLFLVSRPDRSFSLFQIHVYSFYPFLGIYKGIFYPFQGSKKEFLPLFRSVLPITQKVVQRTARNSRRLSSSNILSCFILVVRCLFCYSYIYLFLQRDCLFCWKYERYDTNCYRVLQLSSCAMNCIKKLINHV